MLTHAGFSALTYCLCVASNISTYVAVATFCGTKLAAVFKGSTSSDLMREYNVSQLLFHTDTFT